MRPSCCDAANRDHEFLAQLSLWARLAAPRQDGRISEINGTPRASLTFPPVVQSAKLRTTMEANHVLSVLRERDFGRA